MNLSKYNFNQSELTAVIENNQPAFVAKDICKILGIGNVRDAMTRLDADERVSVVVDTLEGKQKERGQEMKTFLKWFFLAIFIFDVELAVLYWASNQGNWDAGNSCYIPESK